MVQAINSNISHFLSRQENISLTAVQIMEVGHVLTVTDYLHRSRFPSLHTGNHSTASHIAFLSARPHPIWNSMEPTMESEQAIMVFTYKNWATLESITYLRPPLMWGVTGSPAALDSHLYPLIEKMFFLLNTLNSSRPSCTVR